MAFPQSVLPVRVKIAPGGMPAADPATYVWEDITEYVRVASGITIEEGRADEGSNVDPSKCTLTIDNRTGDFSTRNVLGRWHGKLSKNDPLQVGTVAVADNFTRTVSSGWGTADTGQSWAVSGTASDWSVSSGAGRLSFPTANVARAARFASPHNFLDIDAQFTVSAPAVMTGASTVYALQTRYIDGSNHYLLSCELNPAGTITAKIRRVVGGTSFVLATLADIPGLSYAPNQKIRVRVIHQGVDLRVKIWPDGSDQPDAWAVTAADDTFPDAGLIGIYLWCVVGNTNTKPLVIAVDDLDLEDVEFDGNVVEWPPRWDKSHKDAFVPITASGVLRRLQQGKSALRSPIVRRNLRLNPVEFHPLEDASGAVTAASALENGQPAAAREVEFGVESTLLGSSSVAKLSASSVMTGPIRAHTSTGFWAILFFVKLPAPPAANTTVITVTTSGTVRTWTLDWDSSGTSVKGYAADGTLLTSASGLYPAEVTPPAWTAVGLTMTQVGGNVQASFLKNDIDTREPVFYYQNPAAIAGTIGNPRSWRVEGSLGLNEALISSVAVFTSDPGFGSTSYSAAANGYNGELASARIKRLCAEQGVRVIVEAGDSEPLGPQRVATFMELLYAAQDADLGILYERSSGLGYRPRGARYNRAVELPLDFDFGHISEAPEPTDDDQRLRNQWTVSRDNGSSAVAANEESIDSSGLYDDSKTINVETDWVLPYHASARVALGTIDEYRWPLINFNLARNPQMIPYWRGCRPFPRLTAVHVPSQVTGCDIDVVVEGTVTTMGPYGWDVALQCSPASPWTSALVEDTDLGRCDADRAELRAEPNPAAVSLLCDFLDGPLATTSGSEISVGDPVFVTAGTGEDMKITAISGASNPQTLTVVRNLNGINLPIPAGTSLRLTTPPLTAL